MRYFWKLYYKWKFGDQYQNRIDRATRFGWMVEDSTSGNLSHFYNHRGEQIRGWHKRTADFSFRHPLVTYYQKK